MTTAVVAAVSQPQALDSSPATAGMKTADLGQSGAGGGWVRVRVLIFFFFCFNFYFPVRMA